MEETGSDSRIVSALASLDPPCTPPSTMKKILVVDDSKCIRTINQIALKHAWDVSLASSGSEALELALRYQPDLILLDVMMPEMDGKTTFDRLRSNADTDSLPVILMSARTLRDDEIGSFVESGAAGTLAKPIDPMTLSEDLEKIYNKYRERTNVSE